MLKLNELRIGVLTVVTVLFSSISYAEITTTKIDEKEEIVSAGRYDGSKNFLRAKGDRAKGDTFNLPLGNGTIKIGGATV